MKVTKKTRWGKSILMLVSVLALLVCLVLAGCLEPGDGDGGSDNNSLATTASFTVSNAAEWVSAVSAINAGGNNKTYTIIINNDFSLLGSTTYTFSPMGLTVTIQGNGTISLSSEGAVLFINRGQHIIIQDTNFKGMNNNSSHLVEIQSGQFTMQGSASIYGNYGGGVFMWDGTFTMNGGNIYGNGTAAGGVRMQYGTFTMNDGTISGNTSHQGGGVCVEYGNKFTMNGGTISGNFAGRGGGVYLGGATFVMNGGIISGNSAYSWYSSGGGVYLFPGYSNTTIFTKTGGTITGYASDPINGNVVKDDSSTIQSGHGHSIAVGHGFNYEGPDGPFKEITSGPGDNLYYNEDGNTFSGAWDY